MPNSPRRSHGLGKDTCKLELCNFLPPLELCLDGRLKSVTSQLNTWYNFCISTGTVDFEMVASILWFIFPVWLSKQLISRPALASPVVLCSPQNTQRAVTKEQLGVRTFPISQASSLQRWNLQSFGQSISLVSFASETRKMIYFCWKRDFVHQSFPTGWVRITIFQDHWPARKAENVGSCNPKRSGERYVGLCVPNWIHHGKFFLKKVKMIRGPEAKNI